MSFLGLFDLKTLDGLGGGGGMGWGWGVEDWVNAKSRKFKVKQVYHGPWKLILKMELSI